MISDESTIDHRCLSDFSGFFRDSSFLFHRCLSVISTDLLAYDSWLIFSAFERILCEIHPEVSDDLYDPQIPFPKRFTRYSPMFKHGNGFLWFSHRFKMSISTVDLVLGIWMCIPVGKWLKIPNTQYNFSVYIHLRVYIYIYIYISIYIYICCHNLFILLTLLVNTILLL